MDSSETSQDKTWQDKTWQDKTWQDKSWQDKIWEDEIWEEKAVRAERLARCILDGVTVERLLAFAAECRSRALRGLRPSNELFTVERS